MAEEGDDIFACILACNYATLPSLTSSSPPVFIPFRPIPPCGLYPTRLGWWRIGTERLESRIGISGEELTPPKTVSPNEACHGSQNIVFITPTTPAILEWVLTCSDTTPPHATLYTSHPLQHSVVPAPDTARPRTAAVDCCKFFGSWGL